MKRFLLFLFLITTTLSAQTYLHGTAGIRGERVTHCLTSTCSGTYLDNGGAGSNYSNSITGGLYRVFCPNAVGQCMRVTFTSFNTEFCFPFACDFLTVGNGATQNSPVLATLQGTPAVPVSYTANNPSGCLTFRFTSDGSITRSGWSATLSCVPCATAGNGPNLTDNNDCSRATEICSGTAFNSNARGPGLVAEGCIGNACPAGGENHTNWYTFTIRTSGTLTMLINPQTNTDDYDFAIYGPNVTCGTLGSPIRCTDSGNTGNTGMNTTAGDNVEDVNGDGFLAQMNVIAGQTYILVVDEWLSNTGNGYDLSFGGTASLDCTPLLDIELIYFGAEYRKDYKDAYIIWGAFSDNSTEYFVVEKSTDGISFDSIGLIESKGIDRQDYDFIDDGTIFNGYTYYRLKWYEGSEIHYSDVSAIAVNDPELFGILIYPNPVVDILTFEDFSDYMGYCNIEIINTTGEIVKQMTHYVGTVRKFEINVKDLTTGVYAAVVKTENNTKTFKIIKQ